MQGEEEEEPVINFDYEILTSELDETVASCISSARGDLFQPFNIILPGNDVSLRERIIQTLDADGQSCSGISFYSLDQFVAELLLAAGVAVLDQPLTRRYLALESIIHSELPDLEYFDDPRQLREGPGYAAAFSSNIAECEAAGLSIADLRSVDSARVRDLASLWDRADSNLGWSADYSKKIVAPGRVRQRFLVENKKKNIDIPARFKQGLFITEKLEPVYKKILKTSALENFLLLKLENPLDNSESQPPALAEDSNGLQQLKARVFREESYETEVEVDKEDDSVRFEEYSVPEREEQAAVQWLLNRLEQGDTPREIGIVFASAERTGSLYSYIKNYERRLSEQCGESVEIPLYVPGGISLADVPGGTRIFALLRALKSFLRQDEMLGILPLLKFEDGEVYNVSGRRWKKWVYEHGMVGGSPSRPADAVRWRDYLKRAIQTARSQIDAHQRQEAAHYIPSPERLELRIDIMQQVLPAIEQLIEICQLLESEEATIHRLWDVISAYAEKWLDTRQDGRDLLEIIDESINSQLPPGSAAITGPMALVILSDLLRGEKFPFLKSVSHGVFLGSFESARFRSLKSLRFIGLNENTLPAVPRQDPVLPDKLRRKINESCFESAAVGLADSDESARRRLRSFYHLLQSVQNRIVFSSSRRDRSNTRRAPSSLFVDLALASGKSGQSIPGDDWIKQEMKLGREKQNNNSYPLTALKQVTAPGSAQVPGGWQEESPRQLTRLVEMQRKAAAENKFSVFDGLFEKNIPDSCLPGLTAEKPLSAGAAGTFLSCPHQFLLSKVLGFREPPEPSPTAQLSPMQFGSLLHEVAEQIYSQIDANATKKSILAVGREIAGELFDRENSDFGLVGADTRDREKNRLLNAVENLIELDYDENRLACRFELERRFGFDDPVQTEEGLFLRGVIDRVEHRRDGSVAIRDLKSGKKKTDSEFLPGYDSQLGVYRLGFLASAEGEVEVDELSYIYPLTNWDAERIFSDHRDGSVKTLDVLVRRTDQWLHLVKDFLEQNRFPRTETNEDCKYCAFKPVCGSGAQEKSKKKLEKAEHDWAEQFLARKEDSQ